MLCDNFKYFVLIIIIIIIIMMMMIIIIIIIIIITLFESQIVLAEHECCTNWGDCKSNKSNQIKSNQMMVTFMCFFLYRSMFVCLVGFCQVR